MRVRERIAKKMARLRRWKHRRDGHLVVRRAIRDYTVRDGLFDFYWRRGFLCVQCKEEWPTHEKGSPL